MRLQILVEVVICVVLVVCCTEERPTPQNTIQLTTPTENPDSTPFVIVSEKPMPSGLPGYWLVAAMRDRPDPFAVLVSKQRDGMNVPMDYYQPGRKLKVKWFDFTKAATGISGMYGSHNVYFGEPIH